MKEQIYVVACPDCDDEHFEGTKLQVENYLKNNDIEDLAEWAEDLVNAPCDQCVYLLDK